MDKYARAVMETEEFSFEVLQPTLAAESVR